MAQRKRWEMDKDGKGSELMEPHYQRCRDGHMDLWYACEPGAVCPLCEVRARGWANPSKPDPLDRWERGK
jgi:hypothetical protein